jgi:molecular chaperone GrpE
MARGNGKPEMDPILDAEHELPASDDLSEQGTSAETAVAGKPSGHDAEVQKLTAERDTLLDRLARLQAEFENARKRGVREQQEFREFAVADAIKALLPVLDSFDRALQVAPAAQSDLRSGVELIHKQLHDALQKLGVRPVPAQGEQFDPHLHEAVEMVDTTKAADHEILEELQRGYKLKERLLRPAMVRVARHPKH